MTVRSILVLHGPNLNLLGAREPSIYGSETIDDHCETVRQRAGESVQVSTLQSNSEAEIVAAVQGARGVYDAIIINAGALTHYSWSLHDALRSFDGRAVEVHLSNPTAREEFRHTSVLSGAVSGTISGFGGLGYALAVEALLSA
ncbi:MAG: type II 3-dehydroquinate dehydratase [Ilumatobacteraceae bacterium]